MDWVDRFENSLLKLAPKNMKQVTLMNSGSEANESAMKQAMMLYQGKKRNGAQPTQQDIDSCLHNQEPGSPQLAVLSFTNAFHGRAFGSGSATRSKWIHKGDFNAFSYWPAAQFPRNKYPLNDPANKAHNEAEEAASLAQVEAFFNSHKDTHPIAAVIVEPIQAEGGDNHASPDFFRKLQKITNDYGAAFIVDEVQTGGGPTGRMWHHESWNLPKSPDFVTFSKKMLTGGFYYADHYRVDKPYRIFNTWMSAPTPVVQLEAVAETIEKDNLLAGVQQTGEYLMSNLTRMQADFPKHVANVRGVGTFIAFDAETPAKRDKIINDLKNKQGVEIGGCGTQAIRLRPALTFQPKHAEQFINALHNVIQADLKH
jgi:4-aminobutyrate aminotransferase/(S)-3-amino-2-methylpropionate transaminase